MQKTFNAFEKATIKNSAKAVAHYQAKNQKLDEKIKALEFEKELNLKYIEQYSKPVVEMTGYEPLQLCEKVSRGSQMDWTFIYPEIVPQTDAETEKEEEKKEEKVEQNEHLYEEEVTLRESAFETANNSEAELYPEDSQTEENIEDTEESEPVKPFIEEDWI